MPIYHVSTVTIYTLITTYSVRYYCKDQPIYRLRVNKVTQSCSTALSALVAYLHLTGRRDCAICPHCNRTDETTEHLVLHCPAHDQARRESWPNLHYQNDPKCLWSFLERIEVVTCPPTGNKRERESTARSHWWLAEVAIPISVYLPPQSFSSQVGFTLEPCTSRAGSVILKNHRAGLGRAKPVSIRPVKSAGWLTCNASVVRILPLRNRTSLFPSHVGVYSTIARPHPHFPCGWVNYIQLADCRIVFWFVSAVGL